MSALGCDEARARLDALVDGELDAAEADAVEAHLAACDACGRERAAIVALVSSLRRVGSTGGGGLSAERAEAVWARLDAALAVESGTPARSGGGDRARAGRTDRAGSRRWRRAVIVAGGIAAAAGVALVVAPRIGPRAGSVAGAPSDDALLRDAESEFARAEEHYARAVADLRRLATVERARWPEAERARFDGALAALDRATAACKEAARGRRADPEAEELLYRAYREQIAFLEDSLLRRKPAP